MARRRPTTATVRMSLPRFILLATSVFLFLGLGALVAWQVTGRMESVRIFFRGSGAMYLVFLAVIEFSLGRLVVRQFSEGEPLQPAWFLIMMSGGCHLVSALCVQILSANSPLNPLPHSTPTGSGFDLTAIHRFGLLVGGPLQMLLLTAGLGFMLRLCRRSGIVVRYQFSDWLLMSIAGIETYFEISYVVTEYRAGQILTAYDLLMAASGPLLILLLVQANLVKGYMTNLDRGMIAKCWSSFTAAIFLTSLGNLGMWLDAHGQLPTGIVCITWFIAFLSATAYTLAPAWQIEAIQSAGAEVGVSRFSPVATGLTALRLLNPGRPQ
jgi:hypothetical protein